MRIPPENGTPMRRAGDAARARGARPGCAYTLAAIGAALFVLLTVLGSFVDLYTDALWFSSVGYRDVFNRLLITRGLLFLGSGALATAFLIGNWLLARWVARRQPVFFGQEDPLGGRLTLYALWGAALFFGLMLGLAASEAWQTVLLYLNRRPFDASDPIFSQNVGFYMFELPLAHSLQGWLMTVLMLALVGVIAIYFLARRPQLQARIFRLPRDMRLHVGVLAALVAFNWAWSYWLDRFDILYSPTGVVYGAGYADVHAILPALNLLALILLAVAALLLLFAFTGWWLPVAVAVGAWVLVAVGYRGIYPSIMQNYQVRPNEFTLEEPFIRHSIAATQRAFGLDRVTSREFDPVPLTAQILTENATTVRNLRLWDYRPLRDTYAQLQEIRSYYDFVDVDIDRYNFTGQPNEIQSVMLSARELSSRQIQNQTWVNTHLEFTHGYGAVMSPVNEVTAEGSPVFYLRNIPPVSTIPLTITQPAIYFGEATDSYVFVKTRLLEFDYPIGDSNAQTTYQGSGGVPIGSFWQRLAFAYRFGDTQILFTDALTPESRILFNRLIHERVRLIAPFLEFDADPYLVVADGRLWWVQDAYTLSDSYPYAQPYQLTRPDRSRLGPTNYIRNAVKVVTDAYNGDVHFYLADPSDPLIQAWQDVFPSLLRPLDEMPASLRAHVRYPEDMFRLQVEAYNIFHMTDPRVFYNREDPWAVAQKVSEGQRAAVEPYYVVMQLAGQPQPEFLLIQPLTPARKDNMIAWLAARSDGPNYGQLVAYNFPKQQNVQGPLQIEARIDQDPTISAQLSLWDQRGSRAIRGNLLVIPVGNSVLYAEPLFLQADQGQIPQLQRVILASQDRPPVMRQTLQQALEYWNAGSIVQSPVSAPSAAPSAVGGEASPGGQPPADRDIATVARAAQETYNAAQEAQRAGDWARYGQELDALRRELEELVRLTGQ